MLPYQSLIPEVNNIAVQAGSAIMRVYESDDFAVENKADNSPLTRADKAAHQLITEALPVLLEDCPVLSEEAADIPYDERRQWRRYWLVDPLDGTKEFIKRNGEFTVNIALIEEQKPVLGVVYAPVKQILYYASAGCGAFKRLGNEEARKLSAAGENAGFVLAGSRSHGGGALQDFIQCVQARLDSEIEVISIGSSLKLCMVAEGRADLYPRLGPTSEWDTAAAQCIVEEAGAQVTDTSFQPLRYNTKESLLNPYFLVFAGSSMLWRDCLKN